MNNQEMNNQEDFLKDLNGWVNLGQNIRRFLKETLEDKLENCVVSIDLFHEVVGINVTQRDSDGSPELHFAKSYPARYFHYCWEEFQDVAALILDDMDFAFKKGAYEKEMGDRK